MNKPDFLYRITYQNELSFDEDGYLTPHLNDKSIDRLSLPLTEEEDIEAIARFFLYAKLLNSDQSFLILKVLRTEITNRLQRKSEMFEKPEYVGFIHKNAIKSILRGVWVPDHEHSVSEAFSKHPLGSKIMDRTKGVRPRIADELNQEEFEKMVGKKEVKTSKPRE